MGFAFELNIAPILCLYQVLSIPRNLFIFKRRAYNQNDTYDDKPPLHIFKECIVFNTLV